MTSSERYARLAALPDIGAAGLATLHDQRVAVLGVGNLGGQLAQHLVLLGVSMVLVDRDVVAEANLGTQGFAEGQLGRAKAVALAERLGPLNPTCRIEPLHADIRQLGLGVLREASLICSCLDSRAVRTLVNEIAVRLGIPWIDGAIDGSGRSLFGRVACYDPRSAESACYLCPYDGASLLELSSEGRTSQSCTARWWTTPAPASTPTFASSALGGAVAALQAIWGMKVLLGRAEEVAGREAYVDLGRHALSTHRLRRNPRCLMDHQIWHLTTLQNHSTDTTVARTFAQAEAALGDRVWLHLLRRRIVTRLRCSGCGEEQRPYRSVDAIDPDNRRCDCGADMHVAASDLIDRFDRSDADPFLEQTWHSLGLPPGEVVVATNGADALYLLVRD